jgi:hypothetical protein
MCSCGSRLLYATMRPHVSYLKARGEETMAQQTQKKTLAWKKKRAWDA